MRAAWIARNTAYNMSAVHTVLNVISGTDHGIVITELGVSMDGVSSSAVPATVELVQSTQAGTGTVGGSPPAIVQVRGKTQAAGETSQHNYTAEPTALTVIRQWYVPQFNGSFVLQFPLGREPEDDPSGGTIKAMAIRVTPSAAVNVLAYMEWERS